FKSKRGLSYHNTMVKKFNIRQPNIDKLPKGIITEFKNIIISFIHHNLLLNFKSMGKQTLSIPCPESLFYAIFSGHIHHYSKHTGAYKCKFCGTSAYQTLAKILKSEKWGHDLDPLLLLNTSLPSNKSRKSQILHGEVLVEWKKRKSVEKDGNTCSIAQAKKETPNLTTPMTTKA
ncbi:45604_t:CDS:2, partial [Gigaspora margarita]